MADLDTRDKRSSGSNPLMPFRWSGHLPLADGTVGQPDRQHVALVYSAISAGAGPTETILDYERGYARGYARGYGVGTG